jgi:hypothetical protein
MEGKQKFRADPKLKLMDQVRQVLRYHQYVYQTEKTYCDWIIRYIRIHGLNKQLNKPNERNKRNKLKSLSQSLQEPAAPPWPGPWHPGWGGR